MKRTAAATTAVAVGLAGVAGTIAATSAGAVGHGDALHHSPIPMSVHQAQLREHTVGTSSQTRSATLTGRSARELVTAIDRLRPYPKGATFACPAEGKGSRIQVARFTGGGHTWVVTDGSCGTAIVFVTEDGHQARAFHNDRTYAGELQRDLLGRRPAGETVPRSVHKAKLAYRPEPFKPVSKRRTVSGKTAKALVTAFDGMARQPKHGVVCEIAGGPSTSVTFRTAKHTWVATDTPCTGVQVTRDGKPLPTLVDDAAWSNAVRKGLAS